MIWITMLAMDLPFWFEWDKNMDRSFPYRVLRVVSNIPAIIGTSYYPDSSFRTTVTTGIALIVEIYFCYEMLLFWNKIF